MDAYLYMQFSTAKPIELDTAIVPSPCLATINEDTTSGTDVPAAINVSPMTESGILQVCPMMVIIQLTTYESVPIHTMHMANVSGYHFFHASFLQSGIVNVKRRRHGQQTMNSIQDFMPSPCGGSQRPEASSSSCSRSS